MITKTAIKNILADAGFDTTDGSHLDRLVDAMYDVTQQLFSSWDINLDAFNVDALSGGDLDRVGDFFGITRLPALRASDPLGVILKVTNETDDPITLPTGVLVRSADCNYVLTNEAAITIEPHDSVFVPFEALVEGTVGNAAVGEINSIDYVGLSVSNVLPVLTGRDEEPDDSYRYRLSLVRHMRMGVTATALEALAYTFPYVANASVDTVGAGLITVFVEPVIGYYDPALSYYVKLYLQRFTAAGDLLTVLMPSVKVVELDIAYKSRADHTAEIYNIVVDYLLNQTWTFSITEIIERIYDSIGPIDLYIRSCYVGDLDLKTMTVYNRIPVIDEYVPERREEPEPPLFASVRFYTNSDFIKITRL